MTSGGDSSDDTAKTADEERQPVAAATDRCTCQADDAFICPRCQDRQFAQQVKQKEMFVGGSDCKTRLLERINGGSFGDIYLGAILDNTEQVAVKIERQNSGSQMLLKEGTVYRKLEGGPGIHKVHWFGMHGDQYNALVMDLMGPSLHELHKKCHHKFSVKTVLLIIDQVMDIIEYVHCQNLVHRDISPNNFMIGRGENANKIYMIDYGHAKQFSPGPQMRAGPNRIMYARSLVGTPRYAGVHAHLGHEAALRDDLEAIGYLLVYFMKGKLPWQGLKVANMKEKLLKVAEMKMNTTMIDLCEGLPQEFALYLDYTRQLRQYDIADYAAVKDLFRGLARREGHQYDAVYDWNVEHTPPPEIMQLQEDVTTSLVSACSPVSH